MQIKVTWKEFVDAALSSLSQYGNATIPLKNPQFMRSHTNDQDSALYEYEIPDYVLIEAGTDA